MASTKKPKKEEYKLFRKAKGKSKGGIIIKKKPAKPKKPSKKVPDVRRRGSFYT